MLKLLRLIKLEYGLLFPLVLFLALNFAFSSLIPQQISHAGAISVTFLIFIIMLSCAFNVVRHADWLAEKFGEPYGTLILTLAVISIEVVLIVTMMLIGKGDPTLARNTMFAVIMIAINGFAGFSLLTGGIKHRTQMYNIEGASAYLAVLIPLITLCLILPNYTTATSVGTFDLAQSIIVIIVCIILYGTFLIKQTITHRDYFKFSLDRSEEEKQQELRSPIGSAFYHISMLVVGLIERCN